MAWRKYNHRPHRCNEIAQASARCRCAGADTRTEPNALRRIRLRGFTIIEVLAASVVVMVLGAVLAQGLAVVQNERGTEWRRQVARIEAANVMERLTSTAWDELIAKPPQQNLSDIARKWLPGGKITIRIEPVTGDSDGRRIAAEVTWLDDSGRAEAPVRLIAWIYRQHRNESR